VVVPLAAQVAVTLPGPQRGLTVRRILGYDLRSPCLGFGGGVPVGFLSRWRSAPPLFHSLQGATGKNGQTFFWRSRGFTPLAPARNECLAVSAHPKGARRHNAAPPLIGENMSFPPKWDRHHLCRPVVCIQELGASILPVGRSGAVCMRETRATGSYSMLRNGYVPVESGLPQGIRLTKRKQASRAKTRRESVSL